MTRTSNAGPANLDRLVEPRRLIMNDRPRVDKGGGTSRSQPRKLEAHFDLQLEQRSIQGLCASADIDSKRRDHCRPDGVFTRWQNMIKAREQRQSTQEGSGSRLFGFDKRDKRTSSSSR